MGWFIGKYGLYGVEPEEIEKDELNVLGLVLAARWGPLNAILVVFT